MTRERGFSLPEVLAEFQALKADLLILAFVTAILTPEFLNTPTHGSICYHPSLLPRHRGGSAINWTVIMGDRKTGLTIFWPDGGIDTGPVLMQKKVPIGPEDTTGTLYFNHLVPMGIDAIVESVELVKQGKAPKLPQDESRATYEPPCDDRVAGIDWTKGGQEVYNLVRGCDPQPGAFTTWGGEKIRFFGAKLKPEDTKQTAGTVLGVGGGGIAAVAGGLGAVAVVTRAGGGVLAGIIRYVPPAAFEVKGAGADDFVKTAAAARTIRQGGIGNLLPPFHHLAACGALILINRHTANLLGSSRHNIASPAANPEPGGAPGFSASIDAPAALPHACAPPGTRTGPGTG